MARADLARRASAEAFGAAMLTAIVVGSGIAAQRLSPDNVGLQLLENSIATGAGLVALILALHHVSGAHFNPVVTLADRIFGGITTVDGLVYITAQTVGACIGAMSANIMFGLDAVNISTHHRSSGALWFSEVIATLGLLVIIFGVARSRRPESIAFAVGGYIAAAYWFTSSTSFANPAIAVGRSLTNTFAGIAPASVPMFVVAEVAGALLGVALIAMWYPRRVHEEAPVE